MIHELTTDRLQVCLVKTGESTPFVSTLELRRLNNSAYKAHTGSLQTFFRADVGSTSNESLRYITDDYRSDVFDRIWQPYTPENWSQILTNDSVHVNDEFKPPENVMATASIPTDPDAHMNISLNAPNKTSRFRVFMYFSEIQKLNSSEIREFNIMYNGRHIQGPIRPASLYTQSYSHDEDVGPNTNGKCTYSLQKTEDSNLPPLLNALEVYLVKTLRQKETGSKEVVAMMQIKAGYSLKKIDWEGDPCAPQRYMWDGVNCSYKHNEPPKIFSLNLTDGGLTGEILNSISNLTNLQVLDLSKNNLTGSIPEFLANMDTLKHINLSSNELSGSIPTSLLNKAQRGSVSLSIEGNPRLCSYASCTSSATMNQKTKPIVILVTIILVLVIAASISIIFKRKRRAKLNRHPNSDDNNLHEWDQSSSTDIANNSFTYEELAQATDDFDDTNLIGQGGFGYVHRGVLQDGTEVAIKQLKVGSGQGEREFQAEIQIISRVHHRHLVSLFGYCRTGSQRLLVYEFVPNKTLEFHLHDKGRSVMEWTKRMKIAFGSAKGLSYLHDECNPKIIHRDIKAANILIDDTYEAKLADFGLAKFCSDIDTHVSTRIMGTFGYLAPEYASSGKLTDKSDVFSFGVLLLELVTGRRPVDKSEPFADDESIVDWAKPMMIQALKDGNFDDLADPRLEHHFDIIEMTRVVACAAASVHHSAKRRPTMTQIVRAFEGTLSLAELTQGASPGHVASYSFDGDYCSPTYREDLKKFKKMAFESQTLGSSGSSGLTSDNGQNPSGSFSTTKGQRSKQEIEPEDEA